MTQVPSIGNELVKMAVEGLPQLETFILLKNVTVNNEIFIYLANSCLNLRHLEIGGEPTEFNNNITFEGIEGLTHIKSKLRRLRFEYCAKIGDLSIQTIASHFGPHLLEFSVVRNYFEKVAKVSDETLKSFGACPNLEKLEIIYTRKLDKNAAEYLGKYFTNLKILNLSGCPI
mmetsp:Transcript_25789/g.19469  ORF Transcript_25789/g.19469 Transcript_25789/m.19469 type:complete len:173 (+) Transcript_25789:517-1035(+)